VLLEVLGQKSDPDSRRIYQRDLWGRSDPSAATCVIELSGTASPRLRSGADRETRFFAGRIERIRSEIALNDPRLVLMYGKGDAAHWAAIAGHPLTIDTPVRLEETTLVFTPHPQERGRTNADWLRVADAIKRQLRL
jgi:hypothetical protein